MTDPAHSPLDEQWTRRLVQALRWYHDVGVAWLSFPPDRPPGPFHEALHAWRQAWLQEQRAARLPAPPPGKSAPEVIAPVPPAADSAVDDIGPDEPDTEWRQPAMPPAEKAAALERLRLSELGECTRCKLSHGRQHIVFGEGNPDAGLMFVGEGPGQEEDRTGRPFVGRAGQLLDDMIRAMSLERSQVYIANVVKCRPPGNRDPETDEISACQPFLFRQIEIIRPKVIVCLGRPAACLLFGRKTSLGALRGSVVPYRGARLIATYHPSYLLRVKPPARQKEEKLKAWTDLKLAMSILGLKVPDSYRQK